MYLLSTIKKIVLEGKFSSIIKEIILKLSKVEFRKEYRRFYKLYKNKEWSDAIQVGSKIIKKDKENQKLLHKLAICYSKINMNDKGEYYIRRSLNLKTKKSIDYIVNRVEDCMPLDKEKFKSEYAYIGGADNLGFIKHEYREASKTHKYLTKIISTTYPMDYLAYKQQYFHSVICERYPRFKSITAQVINCLYMDKEKLFLISFDEVNNDKKDEDNIYDFINISKSIESSIEYKDVIEILRITDRGKAINLSSLMHKSSTHKIIFKDMKNKIRQMTYKDDLKDFINRVEYSILGLKIYKKIIPKDRYVFCHGDFDKGNVLYNRADNIYKVIDWSSYHLAMRGYDLTKCFWHFKLSFKKIREIYLDSTHNNMDDLDKIFFAYNFLIICIERLDKDKVDKEINERIMPLTNYVEDLSKGIKAKSLEI